MVIFVMIATGKIWRTNAQMSELGKTAPNEIYLIVGDTDKDCNFNELAEVTWADKPIYEETAIKYIKSYQLTIPKSIADALDVGDLIVLAWTHGNDLLGKVSDEERNAECRRRNAIAKAYLAGKALGVDLVKVGEG